MSTCPVCGKKAYQMESIVIEGITMHKNCFRCSVCKKTLNGSNFAKNHGIYYCKVHFQQMFKEKGNYDEGFGYTKRSSNWEKKEEEHHIEPKKEEYHIEPKKEEATFSPETKTLIENILKQLDKIDGTCTKLESCGIVTPVSSNQIDQIFDRLDAALCKLEKK
ncbi:LIM zinc finger domain containing protein [Entamoeba histolytica HM-1:IMSS-B]|uniref:LIM zinc finger domain containing protein n=6 Tax=Entamoeba histolytica TaxID=5759 RepID=C4M577_ENTH1|nr:uncharacterized protein EHI_111790 [Entamoeba histolytica HM-1:IMSS]EMD45856.1 LIM zinc finger domain containing protein [Entamoeba histolytica KU27]EMH75960.1 LIM zinc finger domain containing protein [Entamoeba histolytica HM-1:IMSS-B]EMS14974.1 LIM zinc finger domain containing protein [Entamoeba histolytica HM-3:IMSS]ENY62376.1 LIM zinc finger domain containing protein [Entamoeba histolytica HM-1:IMSS-A]GAT96564.1 lim zinc finger domain containing protein [Entamoeba histolytica]|eukprot:XP_650090.1 uncharacterized protein EHI_111790 [Entamoeba histolytica HM-1:IMSS]